MQIIYSAKASNELSDFPAQIQVRISQKMSLYSQQPNPIKFAKPISGTELFRFRIGDYRVLFKVSNNIIFVVTIKKRDKAYLNLD